MGVHDAPQWLISAWTRAALGAGATASPADLAKIGESLLDRWSEPGRHFHNLRHLTDVLARVDELAEETHEPDLVRLAAWYHGAIFSAADGPSYAHRGGEDERASAVLARHELTDLGVPAPAVDRVVDLVMALTRHSPSADDFDCAVLCDADLAMLAADPQRYKAYLAEVRAEYAHLPVEEFVKARIAILRRLEGRNKLFASPLGAAWEESARQNVGAELHRLEKELAKIEAEAKRQGDGAHHGGDNGAVPDRAGSPAPAAPAVPARSPQGA